MMLAQEIHNAAIVLAGALLSLPALVVLARGAAGWLASKL